MYYCEKVSIKIRKLIVEYTEHALKACLKRSIDNSAVVARKQCWQKIGWGFYTILY
jgi:hypothetical protein